MSTPDKPDHARGWRYVEKLLADEEAELLDRPTEGEIGDELQQGATRPLPKWSADELIARARARAAEKAASTEPAAPSSAAPARPIAPALPIRRRWHPGWLVAATFLGAFVLYRATKGPDVVSRAPTNRELAEAERDVAEARCALKAWAECKTQLDEAAKLDPAGESEPRVQKARRDVALAIAGYPTDARNPENESP